MSELIRIYETTNRLRPAEARVIPGQEVNFFDRDSQFSANFKTFAQLKETRFTERALQYYNEEFASMVLPSSWRPIWEGIPLNRWTPDAPFYTPGQ